MSFERRGPDMSSIRGKAHGHVHRSGARLACTGGTSQSPPRNGHVLRMPRPGMDMSFAAGRYGACPADKPGRGFRTQLAALRKCRRLDTWRALARPSVGRRSYEPVTAVSFEAMPRMTSGACSAASQSAGRHARRRTRPGVPGDRRRRIAVPAVVHRHRDRRTEMRLGGVGPGSVRQSRCPPSPSCPGSRGRGQHGVQRDGEGFLGHPPLAEFADQVLGAEHVSAAGQAPASRRAASQPRHHLRIRIFALAQDAAEQLPEGGFRRFAQPVAGGQGMDEKAENSGALPGRGVAVRQGRGIGAELVDSFRFEVGNQAEGRRPHHGAAALRIRIDRPLHGTHLARGQSAQARVAGRAPALQDILGIDPARRLERGRRRHGDALGAQPAQVREPQARVDVRRHAVVGPFQRLEEAVGGVQRHLRVVRERAAGVERGKILQARGAEPGADGGNAVELDGVAQRISERAAQQAAVDARAVGRGVWLAG